MFLLLTNDDGIHASGLKALCDAALRRGHRVLVCAPASQQSAASHRITLDAPLLAKEFPWTGCEAWAVSGSPADCARIGKQLAEQMPDFALSGINNGWNAGAAVFYSGTFSAAREARMSVCPAMAVSIQEGTDDSTLHAAADAAIRLAEQLCSVSTPRLGVWNLNFPGNDPSQWLPLVNAPLSEAFFLDQYDHRVSPRGQHYFWLGDGITMEEEEEGSDLFMLKKGHPVLSLIGGYKNEPVPNFQDISL